VYWCHKPPPRRHINNIACSVLRIQEERSAGSHLWSLWCWSYLHTSRGQNSVLMGLLQSGSMLWGQHWILKPNIGLLCWLEKNGPEDLDNKIKLTEWTHNIKITRPNSRSSDKYVCSIFIEFLASNFGQGSDFSQFSSLFSSVPSESYASVP